MKLTSIGSEFEAVIVAVILFMFGGVIMFSCCFLATQIYLFNKRRILRKRRRDRTDDPLDKTETIGVEDTPSTDSSAINMQE